MFPATYREIRELALKTALHTRMARAIARKSGFRAGVGASPSGEPPTVILRVEFYNQEDSEVDLSFEEIMHQYSRKTYLTPSEAGPGDTQIIGTSGYYGDQAYSSTQFYLGEFTQARVCARVFEEAVGAYLLAGFAFPFEGYKGSAKMVDTGANITPTEPTAMLAPITTPYTEGPWTDIHASFLGQDVQVAAWARNPTLSNVSLNFGIVEVQAR